MSFQQIQFPQLLPDDLEQVLISIALMGSCIEQIISSRNGDYRVKGDRFTVDSETIE